MLLISSRVSLFVSYYKTFNHTHHILTFIGLADMKDKPLEEWRPKNRIEMDAFRKRLVEIITPASVS
jgi:hypothetical protein